MLFGVTILLYFIKTSMAVSTFKVRYQNKLGF